MARLTLRLCCDHDEFFAAYPPVLAHVVLAAMRGRGLLTDAPHAACDILRHLIALLGCALPAKLLSRHLELVRRAAPEGESGGARTVAEAAPGAAGARMPPPLSSHLDPLQSGGACGARGEQSGEQSGSQSQLQRGGGSGGGGGGDGDGDGDGDGAARRERSLNLKELKVKLGIGTPPPRSRPARVLADLRRTSPLLRGLVPHHGASSPETGVYPGVHPGSAPPSPLAALRVAPRAAPRAAGSLASLARASSLSSLSSARGTAVPHYDDTARPHQGYGYGVSLAAHVRHSVPDERCTLGGTESYRGKTGSGAVERAATLRRQFHAMQREAAAEDRQRKRELEVEKRELDVAQVKRVSERASEYVKGVTRYGEHDARFYLRVY